MNSVLLHDERLTGNTPNWPDTIAFDVKQTDSTSQFLGWVNIVFTMNGKIDNLSILCHGYENNGRGGYGLQLGQNGVFLTNINQWAAIRSMVKQIIIYACSTADADPATPAANGRALCSTMASVTGATVIAAIQTQYYYPDAINWKRLLNQPPWNAQGEIDFGTFEGPVYGFWPDGTIARIPYL